MNGLTRLQFNIINNVDLTSDKNYVSMFSIAVFDDTQPTMFRLLTLTPPPIITPEPLLILIRACLLAPRSVESNPGMRTAELVYIYLQVISPNR